jgi:hypothetical protein
VRNKLKIHSIKGGPKLNSKTVLGADYMESFQPGLNFSPVNRAEIASRLHGQFEPGLSFSQSYIFIPCSKQTRAEMSSRAEIIRYHERQYSACLSI